MLSKMFYIGVLTPACITVAFFIAFLICWFKCGLKEKFLRKRYPEHFNKNEPNVQFTDLTFRNRNCGFTERDVPESDGHQSSIPSSHSYETMADSHSAAESDHSSISNSSTQRMLGVGSKESQRSSQPHSEPQQTVIPTLGESAIYGVQRPGWNYPTHQCDYNINKHLQMTNNKQNENSKNTTKKQPPNIAHTSIHIDNKNITHEWIKNYRCNSLEDHYKHCVVGVNKSDIKTSNYVPGNYVSAPYPEAPEDTTRGQQYLQSQTRDIKQYHPPPPDVTYNHPPAHHEMYIPRSLSDSYGMFITQQSYPQVHSGPNYYQGTDSEYTRDYIYPTPSQNKHRVAMQMVS